MLVQLLIDEAGRPRQVRVAQSSGHVRLDDAALAAVRAARFKPCTENAARRGRGKTRGAVDQASKQPFGMTRHEIAATLGSDSTLRLTGAFNAVTGENGALRINVTRHTTDGTGNQRIDKSGIAPTLRWGIGTADEFQFGLYHLDNHHGIHDGLPWLRRRTATAASSSSRTASVHRASSCPPATGCRTRAPARTVSSR